MKKPRHKINKYELALIVLARHIERNPYSEYKVEKEICDILGIQKITPKK